MLTRLYVHNYRSLVNFELKFTPQMMLGGYNGSGKTSVFEVLASLQKIIEGSAPINVAFPFWSRCRWMDSPVQIFEIGMSGLGGQGEFLYRLEVEHHLPKKIARIKKEFLLLDSKPLFQFDEGKVSLYRDDHSEGPKFSLDWTKSGLAVIPENPDNTRLTWFKSEVERWIIAGIDAPRLFGISDKEELRLDRNATNFANFLRYLSQEYQSNYFDLIKHLRECIPGFNSTNFRKYGGETKGLEIEFTGADGRTISFAFSEISDGQRALIVLYTILYGRKGQGVSLFIDEPDNYLALPEIQPWLMALTDAVGTDIQQAVLISHHPEVMNYMAASQLLWLHRSPNGPTQIKELPDLAAKGLIPSQLIEEGWEPV